MWRALSRVFAARATLIVAILMAPGCAPVAEPVAADAGRTQLASLAAVQRAQMRLLRTINAKIDGAQTLAPPAEPQTKVLVQSAPSANAALAEIVALQRQQLDILKRLELERGTQAQPAVGSRQPRASTAGAAPTGAGSQPVQHTGARSGGGSDAACLASCQGTSANACRRICQCRTQCSQSGGGAACNRYCAE